jgi:hypothetical protein
LEFANKGPDSGVGVGVVLSLSFGDASGSIKFKPLRHLGPATPADRPSDLLGLPTCTHAPATSLFQKQSAMFVCLSQLQASPLSRRILFADSVVNLLV